ncbi:uncharacterized protein LY89DRAFT_716106 [Mollisia scopiformis]|uniref:Protein HRI1 n=1 Tax=Mollisia scopiformis TaxID=149040 RepID=A0A194XKX9_MOLSC|nr:uncharacterized protein LY89DRAFT_716106 [Mollisia scopiformis]KUJ20786.1 hypothetical protein LY89DRAFT_716106 [Mollisia scopiformis]
MDNPFISVRKYIKWGDEPRGENTNTLVLTTRSKHYIDIRIHLPLPLPNDPSDATAINRLEWAFAGTCHSTPAKLSRTGELLKPAHTVWKHWVDSNNDGKEEVKDEGDMYPQSDGSVLEYGEMVNPARGRRMKYEECWEDVEARLVGVEEEFVSWILICDDEEGGRKGMLVRVGDVIQGLVRDGAGSRIVRWEWRAGENEEEEEWERTVGIGRLEVPGVLFEEGKRVEKGDELMGSDGVDWVCVEAFEWS